MSTGDNFLGAYQQQTKPYRTPHRTEFAAQYSVPYQYGTEYGVGPDMIHSRSLRLLADKTTQQKSDFSGDPAQ